MWNGLGRTLAELKSPILLLYNPRIPAAEALAHTLIPLIETHGYSTVVGSSDECEQCLDDYGDTTLVITLGGDGTILKVARTAANREGAEERMPLLLTIDFGTVGFLTELPPAEAEIGVRRVLSNDFWVEERRLLHARLQRDGEDVANVLALNDVVLARGDGPHAIRMTLSIDGAETARYTADGMVIASPTGSTAYALAAGGPIIAPTMNVLQAVPVAPHLAIARGFVVPADSIISLTASAYRATVVTLDGQVTIPYATGDVLLVTSSAVTARFVRLGAPNYFYTTLQDRLRRI